MEDNRTVGGRPTRHLNETARNRRRCARVFREGRPLRFRRSTDHGATWTNFGNQGPEVALADQVWNPEISVGLDGTVHIVWHHDGGTTIDYRRSTDGAKLSKTNRALSKTCIP